MPLDLHLVEASAPVALVLAPAYDCASCSIIREASVVRETYRRKQRYLVVLREPQGVAPLVNVKGTTAVGPVIP